MKKRYLAGLLILALSLPVVAYASTCLFGSGGGTNTCTTSSTNIGKGLLVSSTDSNGYITWTLGTIVTSTSPSPSTTISGASNASNTFNLSISTGTMGIATSTSGGSSTVAITVPGNLNAYTNGPGYITSTAIATGTANYLSRYDNSGNLAASSSIYQESSTGNLNIGSSSPITQFDIAGLTPSAAYSSTSTTAAPTSVFTIGNYSYVVASGTTQSTLQIFDVTKQKTPTLISTSNLTETPLFITVQGNYTFIGTSGHIFIYDITNPSVPLLVSSAGSSGKPIHAVYINGRYFYYAGYTGTGATYFYATCDISNLNAVSCTSAATNNAAPNNIKVQGRYAYTVDSFNNLFYVEDGSVPSRILPFFATVGQVAINAGGSGLDVVGRYAYVTASSTPGKLQIIDVSTIANPTIVGSLNLDGGTNNIIVQGRYAYVTNGASSTMQAIDVSNPAAPFVARTWSTGTLPSGLSIDGHYAYVTNKTSNTLQVFDLGGAYIQQFETGAIDTTGLKVKGLSNFNDVNIQGSLNISRSFSTADNFSAAGEGVVGSSLVAGSVTANQVSPPVVVAVTPQGATGSATYTYALTARTSAGNTQLSGGISTTVGNDDLSVSNNRITWSPVPGAFSYTLYRTVATGATTNATGSIAIISGNGDSSVSDFSSMNSYLDTGALLGGAPPAVSQINTSGNFVAQGGITLGNAGGVLGGTANTTGKLIQETAVTWKNTASNANATVADNTFNAINAQTNSAVNTGIKYTNTYNVKIVGAPIAGTNVSASNTTAFAITSNNVGASTTNSYASNVAAMTGATNNYGAVVTGGNSGFGTVTPSSTVHVVGTFQLSASSSVTTASIGGGSLLAGACASATSSIDTSVVSSSAAYVTTPQNYPGAGYDWHSYLSATGVLTTEICAEVAGTPTATAYNVKIIK